MDFLIDSFVTFLYIIFFHYQPLLHEILRREMQQDEVRQMRQVKIPLNAGNSASGIARLPAFAAACSGC